MNIIDDINPKTMDFTTTSFLHTGEISRGGFETKISLSGDELRLICVIWPELGRRDLANDYKEKLIKYYGLFGQDMPSDIRRDILKRMRSGE